MKVLIPFSGGINSSYSLWRWLKETDDEIHAFRQVEWFETEDRKVTAARNMVQWLKDNVRDFTFEEVETSSSKFDDDVKVPMRPGFTFKYNIKALIPRWETLIKKIDEIKPDAVVRGSALETSYNALFTVSYGDVRERMYNRDGVKFYLSGNRDLTQEVDHMNPSDPDEWMEKVWFPMTENFMGRFEQWEELPDGLKSLYEEPHKPRHDLTTTFCRDCLFEEVQEKRTDMTGREKDLAIAEVGLYGPYWREADPETHPGITASVRGSIELLKDHIGNSEDILDGLKYTKDFLENQYEPADT